MIFYITWIHSFWVNGNNQSKVHKCPRAPEPQGPLYITVCANVIQICWEYILTKHSID